MISASGNRELQTHVDLVVTRMRRLLGLTPQSNHWRPWIDGYTEVLALLEHGDAQAAMARYRRIYAEVRADLESGEAAAQGLEAARSRSAAIARVRREQLGRVVGAGVDVQLRRHARLHQPLRERDVLVAEEVDRADVDEARAAGPAGPPPGPGRRTGRRLPSPMYQAQASMLPRGPRSRRR